MSEATITFSLIVVSMFFRYLESMKIDNLSKLTAKNVSDFWGNDELSGRKPTGIQAYAYKLKSSSYFSKKMDSLVKKTYILQFQKFLQSRFQ